MIEVHVDFGALRQGRSEVVDFIESSSNLISGSSTDNASESVTVYEIRTSTLRFAPVAVADAWSVVEARTDLFRTAGVEPAVEPITIGEVRTSVVAFRPVGLETIPFTEARTSTTVGVTAGTESFALGEIRVDDLIPTGDNHTVDSAQEAIVIEEHLEKPLNSLQTAEITLEENPMPGNVVRMDAVSVSYTAAARADITQTPGRIRVRVTNLGTVPVFVGTGLGVTATTGEPVDPQGGIWEQYWTEAIQVWLIAAGTGVNQNCILTQTAVQ